MLIFQVARGTQLPVLLLALPAARSSTLHIASGHFLLALSGICGPCLCQAYDFLDIFSALSEVQVDYPVPIHFGHPENVESPASWLAKE